MNILSIIFIVSIIAGFIDAIAGGGGLILLPTLIFAGLPAPIAVATNKLFNVTSSLTSAYRFYKLKSISWSIFRKVIPWALIGSFLGSQLIGSLDRKIAEPLIASLLILVALIVLFKKDFGSEAKTSFKENAIKLCGLMGLIGIHDGFFGPGAGIFLIFTMIHFGNATFLKATGTSKVINLLTSSIALVSFILQGSVHWRFGLIGSVGVMIGSYLGAGFAGKLGAKAIRPVFLCIAVAIVFKIMM
jgi:uncharacterized membrane protein YfcA